MKGKSQNIFYCYYCYKVLVKKICELSIFACLTEGTFK